MILCKSRSASKYILSAPLQSFSYSSAFQGTYSRWQPLETLKQPSLAVFQAQAFKPLIPYHLTTSFDLPASTKWINKTSPRSLNTAYFYPFQDDLYLPMELTIGTPSAFKRTTAPLSLFLSYVKELGSDISQSAKPRIYIAQAPLDLLPPDLRKDIPIPNLVLSAGKGDVYDSSLWAGPSNATRTPLHRDPNPNILVQIAGTKIIRLLPPDTGNEVYDKVRNGSTANTTAGRGIGTMRGEEMMGQEGQEIDQIIWQGHETLDGAHEAILKPGDGIFIPNGWWHSIRGDGKDFNISANWWFR